MNFVPGLREQGLYRERRLVSSHLSAFKTHGDGFSDLDYFVLEVDPETTDQKCLVLVQLHELTCPSKIQCVSRVFARLGPCSDLGASDLLDLVLNEVKLLPRFLIELDVKLLLQAHLFKLL